MEDYGQAYQAEDPLGWISARKGDKMCYTSTTSPTDQLGFCTTIYVKELFELYDPDAGNNLSLNELAVLLQEIGNKITALPAVSPQTVLYEIWFF